MIVASTSAAADLAADRTGPVLQEWLRGRGLAAADPVVVPDGEPVGAALRLALARRPRVILTTGGTGVSPTDRTPEMTEPLLDLQLPGLLEALRERGRAAVPAAVLTRGVAGFAGLTFIMNLPGSPGGVADGIAVLDPILHHLLAQRAGVPDGEHPAADQR